MIEAVIDTLFWLLPGVVLCMLMACIYILTTGRGICA